MSTWRSRTRVCQTRTTVSSARRVQACETQPGLRTERAQRPLVAPTAKHDCQSKDVAFRARADERSNHAGPMAATAMLHATAAESARTECATGSSAGYVPGTTQRSRPKTAAAKTTRRTVASPLHPANDNAEPARNGLQPAPNAQINAVNIRPAEEGVPVLLKDLRKIARREPALIGERLAAGEDAAACASQRRAAALQPQPAARRRRRHR